MVSKAKDTIIIMTHKIIPVHDKKDVNLDTLNLEPKTVVESLRSEASKFVAIHGEFWGLLVLTFCYLSISELSIDFF